MYKRFQEPVVLDYASQPRPMHCWNWYFRIYVPLIVALLVLGSVLCLKPRICSGRGCPTKAAEAMVGPSGTIVMMVEEFHRQLGAYPNALADLLQRPDNIDRDDDRWYQFLAHSSSLLDPWGNPLVYRNPVSGGQGYELISCGPDGIPNTSDDITNPRS